MALPTDEELARIREDARRFTALTLRTASEVESEARAFAIDRARQSRPYYSAPNVIRFPIERRLRRV
jgi:hypothetical protein